MLVVLCLAEALLALDSTVVGVALPSIGRDLALGPGTLQWVVTAYTLTLGSCLLLGGRLGDAFGRRRLLIAGLALFGAGSLLGGLSRAAAPLLAARAVGGLGAALSIPAALALVTDAYREGPERHRALGTMSAAIDVAIGAGAVVGGVVTAALGWPWVFLLVAPVALAAAFATGRTVSPGRARSAPGTLDVPGALAAAAGLAALVFALTRAQAAGVAAPSTLAAAGAAVALLAGFAAIERRSASPLLPGRLLGHRRTAAANLAIAANAGGFAGLTVLSTLYMQRVLGLSPLEAGLGFVPLAISAGVGGPLAGPAVARLGVRRVVAGSLAVTAAAVALLARAPVDGAYAAAVLPTFAIAGLTFATAAVPLTAEAVAEAPAAEKGVASGLFQTSTHVGGAVVVAIVVVVAAARAGGAASGGAEGAAALAAGYRLGFLLVAALLAAGLGAVAFLPDRGGHRDRPAI